MIAPLAKFIDRSVLRIGYAMLPQSTWREAANERDLKLEQAVEFLNGPDFIPAESQPGPARFYWRRLGRALLLSHAATVRVRGEQCRSWPVILLRGHLAEKAGDHRAARWR
jgi:hypothetical protein